jgi:hypothetical protein
MNQRTNLAVVQVAAASNLVAVGDLKGAQTALAQIADTDGDHALVLALNRVPAGDLSQVLVATATQPTAIVGDLVTPKQFVKALVEVPKTWTSASEQDTVHQLGELFLGVVMRPNQDGEYGASAPSFLREILKNGDATRLLIWWFSHFNVAEVLRSREVSSGEQEEAEEQAEAEAEEPYESHRGDWDHLLQLVHNSFPALSKKILDNSHMGVPGTMLDFLSLLPSVSQVSEAGTESALWYLTILGRLRTALPSRYQGMLDVLKEEIYHFLCHLLLFNFEIIVPSHFLSWFFQREWSNEK